MKLFLYKITRRILSRIRGLYWQAIYEGFREKYSISKSFQFNGTGIRVYGSGLIHLGANSYIGELSTIQASEGYSVTVGDGV